MRLPLLAALLSLACTGGGSSEPATSTASTSTLPDACGQNPTGQVALPADDAQHTEALEWWYWTGHLQDDQGRRYGFEQAFFVFQISGYLATSAHVALTDLDADRFLYDIAYVSGQVPTAVADGFDMAAEGNHAVGGDGHDALTGSILDAKGTELAAFELTLDDAKSPVLHHQDGYTEYDVGGYTWYYSRPGMDVTGTVTVDGEDRAVTGTGWFDHQWGDLMDASSAGWDWFGIQLDDDREIMLFMVNGSTELVGATVLDSGCHPTWLEAEQVSVEQRTSWTSPTTGNTYPTGWTVQVGDEQFQIDAVMEDQELANDYQTYWEGECSVTGDASGRAYVELVGSGSNI